MKKSCCRCWQCNEKQPFNLGLLHLARKLANNDLSLFREMGFNIHAAMQDTDNFYSDSNFSIKNEVSSLVKFAIARTNFFTVPA